jgi:glycosyltransferase involved in cell wall biosynthesis
VQLLDHAATKVKVYPSRCWFAGREGAYLYPPSDVAQALTDFRPDLVHVEQEVFALSAAQLSIAASLAHKPLTMFCWENVDRTLGLRHWTRALVLRVARAIVAGNSDAASLLRKWGYEGPISIVPQYGVDVRLFAPRPIQQCRQEFVIGFVGRLVSGKGVDLLLRAAAKLVAQGPAIRLMICGIGPEEASLRRLAADLGLADLITWTGFVAPDRVADVIRRMDVLVLPSRRQIGWVEQFGHVLIEAMASGVPTVGSSSGAIPSVIGRDDLIFEEENVAALVAILQRLMSDQSWRAGIREYCVARVRDNFTHERVAWDYVRLWSRVLDGHLCSN